MFGLPVTYPSHSDVIDLELITALEVDMAEFVGDDVFGLRP
jgi:hypothetical protein